jgi:hypothetical protein
LLCERSPLTDAAWVLLYDEFKVLKTQNWQWNGGWVGCGGRKEELLTGIKFQSCDWVPVVHICNPSYSGNRSGGSEF